MSKLRHFIAGVSILLLLAACGKKEDGAGLEPISGSEPAPAAEQPAVAGTTEPAKAAPAPEPQDAISWRAGTDKTWTQRGKVVDGKLVNDSSADGYVLFGPYVPFKAGTYTVAFQGNVETVAGGNIHLDVSSDVGKARHGGVDISQAGAFPTFDVTLEQDVSKLEVRIKVPKDSKVSVESYQVAKKQ